MPEPYTLIAPMPQLKLEIELSDYNLVDGLSIRPLKPHLRRRLLDITKQRKCSDDCLLLLSESELIFCAQIPTRNSKADGSTFFATVYSSIAEEILKRIFRCFLLFEWVPAPLFHYCWFLVAGTPDEMDSDTLKILDADWQHVDQFTNIDWRFGEDKPEDISLGMKGLQRYWDKLSLLCQVDQLKDVFTNEKIEKECLEYAHQYVIGKVEELMKAKYGPDTVVDREPVVFDTEVDTNAEKRSNGNDLPIFPTTSSEMQRKWMFVGLGMAYANAVGKLSQEPNTRIFDRKLDRAFQLYIDAFRMHQPHQFITFATCLETLFCTGSSEIAFQLASRIGWFLHPDDYSKRAKIFAKAKSLYSLRSKIVHGVRFDVNKVRSSGRQMIFLARMAFDKIIRDDAIFHIFRHKDQAVCKEYLEGLNLGKHIAKKGERNDRQN